MIAVEIIDGDSLIGIFNDRDFGEAAGPGQQIAAIIAQMQQMQLFAFVLIAFGRGNNRLQARMVPDPGILEVDDHMFQIVLVIEQPIKAGDGTEEQRTEQQIFL